MHQARKIAGFDAAKLVLAPEKCCGIKGSHAQGIFQADAEPPHAIAHSLIHCQIGAGKSSVIQHQFAIHQMNRTSMQCETVRTARGRRL